MLDPLVVLIDRIAIFESRIRHRETDGVHGMRVTLRRLRSVFGTYAPLFDAATIAALREEIQWIGEEMSGARDTEVVHERLLWLARTPEERLVVERVLTELDLPETADVQGLVATLDSQRFGRALHDLNAFVAEPPLDPASARASEHLLRKLVRRDWRRLRRRARRARKMTDPDQRQAALHEVRKAAKTLRYSAEILVPLHGRDASRMVDLAKEVQTSLGLLQDSVVARQVLHRSAESGSWTAEELATLSTLNTREQQLAARQEKAYGRTWDELARKKYRRWLT